MMRCISNGMVSRSLSVLSILVLCMCGVMFNSLPRRAGYGYSGLSSRRIAVVPASTITSVLMPTRSMILIQRPRTVNGLDEGTCDA